MPGSSNADTNRPARSSEAAAPRSATSISSGRSQKRPSRSCGTTRRASGSGRVWKSATAKARPCRFSRTRLGGPCTTCSRGTPCSRWRSSWRRSRGEGGMSPTPKSSRSGPSPCTIAGYPCATSVVAIRDQRSGSTLAMIRQPPSPRRAVRRASVRRGPSHEPGDNGHTGGDVARHEEAGMRARLRFEAARTRVRARCPWRSQSLNRCWGPRP
jgi:hypothetical protein